MHQHGIFALAVDHERNNHRQLMPTIKVDLADAKQTMVLVDLLQSSRYTVILWCAVPCGTCSRAREIKIPGLSFCPQPLRDKAHPRGLPSLKGLDAERVSLANSIYDNVWLLIQCNLQFGGFFVIENPRSSWLWSIDTYEQLLRHSTVTDFQHCKWTPDIPMRAKWTRLVSNIPVLTSLNGPCALGHEHLAWGRSNGVWATSQEAEYPQAMCDAITACLTQYFGVPISLQPDSDPKVLFHKKRKVTSKQPRGKVLPSIIPEFDAVLTLPVDTPPDSWHKILRSTVEKGESGNDEVRHVVGIWRTPQKFVEEALTVSHPIDTSGVLEPALCASIKAVLESEPADMVKSQLNEIKRIIKLKEDLKSEESQIHERLDPQASMILHDKSFKLLEVLLAQIQWPDTKLVEDMVAGFSITGHTPFSGVFLEEPKVASITEQSLRASSTINNQTLMVRTKSSGDEDIDIKLWSSVKDEAESGWLTGPFYNLHDLSLHLNNQEPHLSRRFPLVQGDKIRSIDDLCESNVNAAFASCEKIWLMDTDYIVNGISTVERTLNNDLPSIFDSSGNAVVVNLHHFWSTSKDVGWKGRTIDLKAAYKQLHVCPTNRWASCIAVFDPEKQLPAMFVQNTLPFGSSSSVTAFNRVSRALWALGCRLLNLIWWNFYDDFPIITPAPLMNSNYNAALLLLKVLGFRVSLDPNKTVDWASSFAALGITFDITGLPKAQSTVLNTSKRTEKIVKELESIIASNKLSDKDAERIRGKLQFMDAQIFGRVGKGLLAVLFKKPPPVDKGLSPNLESQLRPIIQWLTNCSPRKLSPALDRKAVHVFTDGACEEQADGSLLVTCGAVIIDPNTGVRQTFGVIVNGALIEEWIMLTNKRQLITEAELLPVIISKRTWASHLSHAKVILWVDSEPAKFSLIRGISDTPSCNMIVQVSNHQTVELQCNEWYSRVPSKSNPADDPSRLVFDQVVKDLGLEVISVEQPTSLINSKW
jgi:hypothetical protein